MAATAPKMSAMGLEPSAAAAPPLLLGTAPLAVEEGLELPVGVRVAVVMVEFAWPEDEAEAEEALAEALEEALAEAEAEAEDEAAPDEEAAAELEGVAALPPTVICQ